MQELVLLKKIYLYLVKTFLFGATGNLLRIKDKDYNE